MREETERNKEIVKMWEGGAKYYEIAQRFNLSVCRAQRIVQNYCEETKMRKKYGELAEIPHGTRNALLRNGYTKKEQIVFRLRTGTFEAGKGIGIEAIRALEELTGLAIRTEDGEIPTYHNIKHKRLKGVKI